MTIEDAKKWFGVYYSQNQEDLILKAFFANVKDGFYVDVGAHDPEIFSVTKLFYDDGWSGINIEPQDEYHKKLNKARPRDTNLRLALGSEPGSATFTEYPDADGLSTLSTKIKNSYKTDKTHRQVTAKTKEYSVEVSTLREIHKKYIQDKFVHFLKIDVEGFEKEVLLGNDWEAFRPQILCIESNHEVDGWHGLVTSKGYTKIFWDGLNEYFAAEEKKDELMSGFNYTQTVLTRVPMSDVPFQLFAKELRSQSAELKKLNDIINRQDKKIQEDTKEIEELRRLAAEPILKKINRRLQKKQDKS